MAVTQLSSREIINTWNSDRQYSPVESSDRGRWGEGDDGDQGGAQQRQVGLFDDGPRRFQSARPRWRPTRMPSTTTMALSTSMPRAITRAPREMRCSSMPSRRIKIKLPSTVRARSGRSAGRCAGP